MSDEAASTAWDDFCDRLRTLGRRIGDPAFPGAAAQPDQGARMLASLASAGLHWNLAFADPERPAFYRITDDINAFSHANADIRYLYARVRCDRPYRIRGRSRGAPFSVELLLNFDHSHYDGLKVAASLTSEQCRIDPDGRFEIHLGQTGPDGDRVEMRPEWGTVMLQLREYYDDWASDPIGSYEIECLDPAAPFPPPGSEGIAHRLDEAAAWIERAAETFGRWSDYALRGAVTNEIPTPVIRETGAFLAHGWSRYEVGRDQALIIDYAPPEARSYNFQLYDLWGGYENWGERTSSLNRSQIAADADGRARIVIAHRDPGTPNWLDAAGNEQGCIFYRLTMPRAVEPVRTRLVGLDELRKHLPAGTPEVTPAERAAAIAIRRAHLARRFRN